MPTGIGTLAAMAEYKTDCRTVRREITSVIDRKLGR